jgi:hypothetical protein
MNHKVTVGPNTIEFDDQGRVVSAKTGETKFSLRADDGITGTIAISCANGHAGLLQIPAVIASLTGKELNVEDPCPACGAKVSAPGGFYQRRDDGVFERVSDMPN